MSDKCLPISITFVRHGENEINKNIDNNLLILSDTGKIQAKKVAKILNNDFDVVFSSISKRALITASIISFKNDIIEDKRLIEKGYGNGKCGNESIEEVDRRIISFLDDVCLKYSNKKVLVITHGALIKEIENIIENKILKRDRVDNCDIYKYSRVNKDKTVSSSFVCKEVIKVNSDSYNINWIK